MEQHLQFAFILSLITCTMAQIEYCDQVMSFCEETTEPWSRCFENYMATCSARKTKQRKLPREIRHISIMDLESTEEMKTDTSTGHTVHIPTEVLERAGKMPHRSFNITRVAVVVLNGSLFQTDHSNLLGRQVLGVKVGTEAIQKLSQPVELTFRHDNQTLTGQCMFWEESDVKLQTGRWSTQGCKTKKTNSTFVCSCDHLSFFAVLINAGHVDEVQAASLSYISYIGCGFSILCTLIAILTHVCMRLANKKGRDEHSVDVHVQLMGALLLLHTLFLVNAWLGGRVNPGACMALGLLLHWALLATFTWMVLEGFHLYLLLIRVFNIYIRRYLLKLCLVGWGVPTIIVVLCASLKPYGIYSLQSENESNTNSRTYTDICWVTNVTVRHITVTAYLALVFLVGASTLGIIMMKLLKMESRHTQEHQRKKIRRKCMTLLGLSCVLGVPWGLAFFTYGPLSLFGLYFFTIANAFQGVFVFIWFFTLTCKLHPTNNSTATYQSTRKTEN